MDLFGPLDLVLEARLDAPDYTDPGRHQQSWQDIQGHAPLRTEIRINVQGNTEEPLVALDDALMMVSL